MKELSPSSGVARRLRQRSTNAERKFWLLLRDRRLDGWKFRRQVPLGPYVADFYCAEAKLVVELDGGQHAIEMGRDQARTDWLTSNGYAVIRYWNNDVLESAEGVLSELLRHLQAKSPLTLSLSREGRGDAVADSLSSNSASKQDLDSQIPPTANPTAKTDSFSGPVMDERSSVPSPLAGEGQGEGEITNAASSNEPPR